MAQFIKGESGNPGGRPKEEKGARELARKHTRSAVATLLRVMRSKKASDAARVSAAVAILDRGYGKPPQHLDIEGTLRPADVSSEAMPAEEWDRRYGNGVNGNGAGH